MRIVQINAVYEYSSTGRSTMEIHKSLQAIGWESYVFCTNKFLPNEHVYLVGNKLDYKIHAFFSRLFGLQGYFSKRSTCKLIKQLKLIKPDVVHLSNLHANYINFPLLLDFLRKEKISTVLTLHDCWFFTGHCCHYTEDNCLKWKSYCENCPTLKKYNNSWFFDRSFKMFEDKKRFFKALYRLAVIGNSDWTTEQARYSFLKDATVVERIYNWIDLDFFYPRDKMLGRGRLSINSNDFLVLGVAQGWSKGKGILVFVEIAKRFPMYKVLLVGKLQEKIILPENVIVIPATTSVNELAEYYSAADVFVNPSIQETFGLVSAESLACGTPLIVNDATANPEFTIKGCGYKVVNNDVDKISEYIKEIVRNNKSYYSKNCLDFARNNFDRRENIAQYVKLYEKLG